MKKVLKYIGIFLLGLILALAVAPFVLKDRIMKEVKKQISANLNADVDFKDVNISFLKSFPEVSLSLVDFNIIGVDTFSEVELMRAKKLDLDFSLLPFFDKTQPMALKYIGLNNGEINILKLNDSLANYLITKPSNDTSKFSLALEKYELINTHFSYIDHTLPLKFKASHVNHSGSGDLSSDVYDLDTKTTADSLQVVFDGFKYLNNIKAEMDAKINVDFPNQKYTLKDNKIKMNKLDLVGDGSVQFVNEEDMKLDAKFSTKPQSFANILSIVPYLAAYNTAKANGTVKAQGSVTGIYNSHKGQFPAFDIGIDIDNGFAQYAGMKQAIKDVFGNIKIKSTRSDMKDFFVDVKNFKASVNNEKIAGNFSISESMVDPHYKGDINAAILLENWATALPMKEVESLKGAVNGNLIFDAKQSDIDKENYPAIKFDGKFIANNVLYKIKGKSPITLGNASLEASPKEVMINSTGVKLGKSDLDFSGNLSNPMAYFSENKNIKGAINLKAGLLDLNEWMDASANANTSSTSSSNAPDINAYKFSEVDTKFTIDKLLYGKHQVDNLNGNGKIGLENIVVNDFNASLDGSNINMKGKLANVYSYLFGDEILVGDLNLTANKFDANKYMVQSETETVSADSVLFQVPDKMNLHIKTKIDELIYTNLDMKNFSGEANIKDKSIILSGLTANAFGGKIAFDGLYSTKGTKPDFSVKLDLSKMEFYKAYEKFITVKQLAPIANYIQGLFNTTLVFEGQLKKGMTPDLSNITASGFIETLNGIIKGFKPVQAVGDKLGVAELANLEIKDTRNWFDIKKGVVELKEFTKNIKGIDLKMSGNHKIQGPMDYDMFLRIPRAMLKKNIVTGTAEKGFAWLEKEAGKKGINIAQGEYIDVKVDITGLLNSPSIMITPLGTSGKSMQEEIKDEVKAQVEKAKDSITKVVNNKVEQVKDSIRNRANEELEKAKKKAEEKATEVVNDTKDKIKKEAEKKLDTLVGKALSDSITKKAEQVIKDKTGKDIEDIKNKVKDWNPLKKKKKDGN